MGEKNATNIALVSHSRKLYVLEYSNYKDYLQLMNLYLLKSPPPPFPLPTPQKKSLAIFSITNHAGIKLWNIQAILYLL